MRRVRVRVWVMFVYVCVVVQVVPLSSLHRLAWAILTERHSLSECLWENMEDPFTGMY